MTDRYELPRKLYKAQNGECFYCGKGMSLSSTSHEHLHLTPNGWTRDHVIPKMRGGRDAANIVLAHLHCNIEKGWQMPSKVDVVRCVKLYGGLGA